MGLTHSLNHHRQMFGAAAEVVETSYHLWFSCISELWKRLQNPGDLSLWRKEPVDRFGTVI